MNEFQANLDLIRPYIRRSGNLKDPITQPRFWLNDVTQTNGAKKMEISLVDKPNWLKIRQTQGHECSFFPIDGDGGVFERNGLPVADLNRFAYEETGPDGRFEIKTPELSNK